EKRISLAGARRAGASASEKSINLGVIGAGSYAKRFLLPNFKAAGAQFESMATASGISAREVGEKYSFRQCVAGADEVIDDPNVNLVVIATRHDSHADLASRALERGHHVFVE